MSPDDPRLVQLPHSLLESYQAYKIATTTVVSWIIQNGNAGGAPSYRLTINELRGITERIKQKQVKVPIGVHQAFEDAIVGRQRVTKHFRRIEPPSIISSNPQTVSHEHFTESLKAIFQILCPREQSNLPIPGSDALPKTSVNQYELLEGLAIDSDLDHTELDASATANTTKTDNRTRKSAQPSREDPAIIDDDLLLQLHTFYYLLEFDHVYSAIKGYWEQAMAGSMSIMLAAWLSNSACKGIKRMISVMYDQFPGLVNHKDLVLQQLRLQPENCEIYIRPTPDIASKQTDFRLGPAVMRPWLNLLGFREYKQSDPLQTDFPKSDEAEEESDKSEAMKEANLESKTMNIFLYSVDVLSSTHTKTYIGLDHRMHPLLQHLGDYLAGKDEQDCTALCYELQVLYESTMCSLPSKVRFSRLKALQFALEVKGYTERVSRESTVSCGCPVCGAVYAPFNGFCVDLRAYVAEKRWDDYYTSPWVAGSHMIELWSWAMDMGLRLCNARGYLGVLLHVCNMLQQLKVITDKIPILDELCDLMGKSVFLGEPPKRNYHGCFTRFRGGKVVVDRDSSQHATGPRAKLAQPPVFEDLDKRRLMPGDLSLFYQLDNWQYQTPGPLWLEVYNAQRTKDTPPFQQDEVDKAVHENFFTVPLEKLHIAVQAEFEGHLPRAKINYFAVYLLCTKILEDMHARARVLQVVGASTEGVSTRGGYIFASTLLKGVDDHQNDSKLSRLLKHLSSLRFAKEAVLSATKDLKVSDFLWNL